MGTPIDQVAAELREIAGSAGDGAGYFPALYARVTAQLAGAIARSEFDDGLAMGQFATTFAGYYLRAFREEVARPRCWQATLDVAADPCLLITQHLLLGINAHVNHDLALAVVEVADERGELASIRPDFDAVNDVLAGAYVHVLHDLDRVSRWANEAASIGAGRVFNFSLRRARRQAWEAAERLYRLDPPGRREYAAELDRLVSVLAFLVTQPPLSLRPAVWVARRFEEDDAAVVVQALLGPAP